MWFSPDNAHGGLPRVGALCGPPLWSSGPDYHFPSLPLCVFGAWQPIYMYQFSLECIHALPCINFKDSACPAELPQWLSW